MSLLDSITTGVTPLPPRIVIYGYEGIGKSTWAAQAPKPIFIQTEQGLRAIECAKFPHCKTFEDVIAQLKTLRDEIHDYQTVVIDSLSALEPLIWDSTCRRFGVKNIEKVDGGYARGYKHALDEWMQVRNLLDELNVSRKMIVILIAHVGKQEVKDPEVSTYDRTAPRLHPAAEALISQWADNVFQAKQKFRDQKMQEGFNQERTIAIPVGKNGGDRVIRTIGTVAVIAKNRLNLPEELPLDFSAFWNAAYGTKKENNKE